MTLSLFPGLEWKPMRKSTMSVLLPAVLSSDMMLVTVAKLLAKDPSYSLCPAHCPVLPTPTPEVLLVPSFSLPCPSTDDCSLSLLLSSQSHLSKAQFLPHHSPCDFQNSSSLTSLGDLWPASLLSSPHAQLVTPRLLLACARHSHCSSPHPHLFS